MILEKVCVKNYRLLRDFELDLKEELSLVVGKNNCGKTSVLSIMDELLNLKNSHFRWEDFNLDYQEEFAQKVLDYDDAQSDGSVDFDGIKMTLYIRYTEKDDYSNLQKFMMDLNPDNDVVVIEFNYHCKENKIKELKDLELGTSQKLLKFMKKNHNHFFSLDIYACGYDLELKEKTLQKSSLLERQDVARLINFKSIKASRDASNKRNDSSLSKLSSNFYKLKKSESEPSLDSLEEALNEADQKLTGIYNGEIFKNIIESVSLFGGKSNETNIKINSTLQESEILRGNTTLYYEHEKKYLPENYNGLGYLNLIGMIFEIEIIITEFIKSETEKPADINLLFIEEPEAHTHPQLQYIFIKNIKKLIENWIEKAESYGKTLKIQTLITTHSSHIVSDSDFCDIRYLKRSNNGVISKNFEALEEKYGDDIQAFHFVKKYLNLNRSELFFADKAIFIEGDTERILLPAMMKEVDEWCSGENLPLLSQNISIVEAGAYAHKFKELIDFLGIKALIITDIDAALKEEDRSAKLKKDGTYPMKTKSSRPENANTTTNSSILSLLKSELGEDEGEVFQTLTELTDEQKTINANIRIAYQKKENNYQSSSFEDAFICLNYNYIFTNKENFKQGLKNKTKITSDGGDAYDIAQECINKKSAFATEILYFGNEEGTEKWKTPLYIKEGLKWLKEQ